MLVPPETLSPAKFGGLREDSARKSELNKADMPPVFFSVECFGVPHCIMIIIPGGERRSGRWAASYLPLPSLTKFSKCKR